MVPFVRLNASQLSDFRRPRAPYCSDTPRESEITTARLKLKSRYVTDKTSLKLRHEIGIDIIAWECDYPHSDCFWPDAPEQVLAELTAAGADDTDINKVSWENSCRFFSWDPFARTPREEATVKALRAKATDVDVSIRPRKEWSRPYAEKQLAKA